MADKRRTDTHILHLRAASIALAAGIALLTLLAASSAQAQRFTTLFTFDGTDGRYPEAAPVQGTDGNLYGTAYYGGHNGYGTIFEITPGGALTVLYSFCSQSGCADGTDPVAPLIQGTDGNFYGAAYHGGNDGCYGEGCGTLFKITLSGTLTALYTFCSQTGCTDGEWPAAGLVQATDGDFYGTTQYGGVASGFGGGGTIFKITPGGTLTTLYTFCSQTGCTDGENSMGGLTQATNGDLYGTTFYGGAHGYGTVYRVTPSGGLTTLYNFCSQSGCADGAHSNSRLVQASDGNFYGTTLLGGTYSSGTVFKITPTGTFTTLYSFCSQNACADGAYPNPALVQAADGNFYGTTQFGGANDNSLLCPSDGNPTTGCGTVFEITPTGTLTTLYSFCSQSECVDGDEPVSGVVEDTNGTFYGTAEIGGAYNEGTVYSLSTGLGPFVETQPTLGAVGRLVKILGTNLTGATSVTFNGMPAVFKVLSNSLIGAKVPAGATTGTVQVVTPSGTLSSNVPFRVRQ